MTNPFVDLTLDTCISIHPNAMNNNIYEHIKNKLIATTNKRCFKDKGYISTIYDIVEEPKGGKLPPEDPNGTALYQVKFSCKMCRPQEGNFYVAKITGIIQKLIIACCGPIKFIITTNNINMNKISFVLKTSAYYPKNKNGEISQTPIELGTYVMIKLIKAQIIHNAEQIIASGMLDDVASDDDIRNSIKFEFGHNV